jgi:putative phosphoesterase
MRVGLLSDTHIPEAAETLPSEIMEAFQGVDLILHAGDIFMPSVLDDLERIAPVLAARGDDDYIDASRDGRVKDEHVLWLKGQKLWLVHERPHYLSTERRLAHEKPYYIKTEWWQEKVALEPNEYETPDIVVFGHIHRPVTQWVDGTLYVCPGSPTFPNYFCALGTVGILGINSSGADVRILQL